MNRAPGSKSWWTTLPGVLTAIAGVITAVSGLMVALQQIGLFDREAGQSVHTASETAATAAPDKPMKQKAPARYPVELSIKDEIRAGPVLYKILAAQLDQYSDNELSIDFSIRFLNTEVPYGVAMGPTFFRLLVDGVPLAPAMSFIDVVDFQSAKDGNVVFLFPKKASSIVLQVGDVAENKTAKIPVNIDAGSVAR